MLPRAYPDSSRRGRHGREVPQSLNEGARRSSSFTYEKERQAVRRTASDGRKHFRWRKARELVVPGAANHLKGITDSDHTYGVQLGLVHCFVGVSERVVVATVHLLTIRAV